MSSSEPSSSSSSASSSSSSSELSSDNEESIPRHARMVRFSIINTLAPQPQEEGVPVYCSTHANRVSAPPNSVVVNGKDGTLFKVPPNFPTIVPSTAQPVLTVPFESGPLDDMAAIKRTSKDPPTAIVFTNTHPQDVWAMFHFYNELMGRTPSTTVTDAVRKSDFDLKKPDTHALFSLATAVGATIFQEAIQTTGDTYPEVSMIRMIVESRALFTKTISYVVIPRMDPATFPYRFSKGPVVMVDASVGVFEVKKKPSIVDKIKGGPKWPEDAINTMSLATYMNLTTLYNVAQKPKLVVFANTDPSGVLAMVNFYEHIVDPKMCAEEPGCKHTIYSTLPMLASMKQVKNSWLVLAKRCGAKPFETILRRN